eukprot:6214830-Amphidinium_carterae.1
MLEDLGLQDSKPMATPGSKDQMGGFRAYEKLDAKAHHEFRSAADIAQYMAEHRFDIAFATKQLMREASSPNAEFNDEVEAPRQLSTRQTKIYPDFPLGLGV